MAGVLDTAQILSPVGVKPPPGFVNGVTTKVNNFALELNVTLNFS